MSAPSRGPRRPPPRGCCCLPERRDSRWRSAPAARLASLKSSRLLLTLAPTSNGRTQKTALADKKGACGALFDPDLGPLQLLFFSLSRAGMLVTDRSSYGKEPLPMSTPTASSQRAPAAAREDGLAVQWWPLATVRLYENNPPSAARRRCAPWRPRSSSSAGRCPW